MPLNFGFEEWALLIFYLFILYIKVSALLEYKKSRSELAKYELTDIHLPKTTKFFIIVISAIVVKFSVYILAIYLTRKISIILLAAILILLRLYVMWMRTRTLATLKIDGLTLMLETLFIICFIVYYFGYYILQ
ncbi:hypothetical protein J32TS2_23590 [Shouchella clausii]|uniref:DUF4181 domain-containing protein n=1 Tax=Shouchella clausii TaxID=79880 RepID=A0A268P643_SHOCL|nr:hypothetical protein [Shouchella clausii]PAD18213.1 hypothetical protein CHH73_07900 [Shouchella clausii]PAD48691.1 hypothetical protein CHI09_01615 [Shouchella clausii]PAE90730.1 hypothetical protein CHH72_02290 [Shouchella clausii]GIN09564.1 hypothetical protein J1TS1_37090 [Shouchella clausii]GIN17003.1 hypothetical protein J32TS2_23590 [Shouchella clausii]